MARPRTAIGTFGAIKFVTMPNKQVCAQTRYRDDGRLRLVEQIGRNKAEAGRLLKEKLAKRASHTGGDGDITADSPFPDLVAAWLDENAVRDLAVNTRELYVRDMRTLVLPTFENYTLREITVSRVDRFLKAQARISYSRAAHARRVLGPALALVVRYEAIPRNSLDSASRLRKPPKKTTALSPETVQVIRTAVRQWRKHSGLSGPKPDGSWRRSSTSCSAPLPGSARHWPSGAARSTSLVRRRRFGSPGRS